MTRQDQTAEFNVSADRFADVEVLRYRVPGFEELSLEKKKLAYYLYEAALSGRDILWDQNYEHNLTIRRTLEAVVESYSGDRGTAEYGRFLEYVKRVWFANGIHHHYSSRKFVPDFRRETFARLLGAADAALLPLADGETTAELAARLEPILFDRQLDAKRVNQAPGVDQVVASANNYYDGVTQEEAEAFYAALVDPDDPRPVSWGLNSQLTKEDGQVVERIWKVGGLYSPALERIVHWLEKAGEVAENARQKKALDLLADFYRTGDLRLFDDYSIAWVADTDSRLDTVNGFIETYGDPLGYRASWEALVSIKDLEATRRVATICENAQWFEDNSPIADAHKKEAVVGISARAITMVVGGGDVAPSSPIGINLPNPNWIRAEHGSKSVTLGNIIQAIQDASSASGLHEEFTLTEEEAARNKEHYDYGYVLEVDIHEILGHGSGKINPGVATPKETLKSYASTLEESRADLVALYFLLDPKLLELGLVETLEVGKACYDGFIRNGLLMQLRRVELGDDIEEAHMRNRQLIASWAYEKGKVDNVIERVTKDAKTYFVIRDHEKLRQLFGELLREVQRIKSEGDYEAGRQLVETYGVQVDAALHREVLERVEPLDIAAYKGFIQPRLVPVEKGGEIADVTIEYPESFAGQMLEFSENYSFLD